MSDDEITRRLVSLADRLAQDAVPPPLRLAPETGARWTAPLAAAAAVGVVALSVVLLQPDEDVRAAPVATAPPTSVATAAPSATPFSELSPEDLFRVCPSHANSERSDTPDGLPTTTKTEWRIRAGEEVRLQWGAGQRARAVLTRTDVDPVRVLDSQEAREDGIHAFVLRPEESMLLEITSADEPRCQPLELRVVADGEPPGLSHSTVSLALSRARLDRVDGTRAVLVGTVTHRTDLPLEVHTLDSAPGEAFRTTLLGRATVAEDGTWRFEHDFGRAGEWTVVARLGMHNSENVRISTR